MKQYFCILDMGYNIVIILVNCNNTPNLILANNVKDFSLKVIGSTELSFKETFYVTPDLNCSTILGNTFTYNIKIIKNFQKKIIKLSKGNVNHILPMDLPLVQSN